jgi:hypothetical protein
MEPQRRRTPMTGKSEGLFSFRSGPNFKWSYYIYILFPLFPAVIMKTFYVQKPIHVSCGLMNSLQRDYIWHNKELSFILRVLSPMRTLVPLQKLPPICDCIFWMPLMFLLAPLHKLSSVSSFTIIFWIEWPLGVIPPTWVSFLTVWPILRYSNSNHCSFITFIAWNF